MLGNANWQDRNQISRKCNDQGKGERMQSMVILRKPQQRMAGIAGKQFGNDPETINIWNDTGQHNCSPFSPVQRSGAGEKPSGKEVGDWAHETENVCKPRFCDPNCTQSRLIYGANIW